MQSTFIGLTMDQVEAMREQDPAIAKIAGRGTNLTFEWLRATVGRDTNRYHRLASGTAILNSPEELDQYLYSYALIVSRQWREMTSFMAIDSTPVRLVDFGCGQGLVGLLLRERLDIDFVSNVTRLVLIEASSVALVRAEAVYRAIAPGAEIVCIKKSFDQIAAADLVDEARRPTIHVFSNVLDIPSYDHVRLFCEALLPGRHFVLAVSHDRDFNGGAARLRELHGILMDPSNSAYFCEMDSQLSTFICSDGRPAVSWVARFGVLDG